MFKYSLTSRNRRANLLNMFKRWTPTAAISVSEHSPTSPPIGDDAGSNQAQRHILATAIRLFRSDGFDETTMRGIAKEAGVALGLAYYYFPGKEALVMAYYKQVQQEHARVARAKLSQAGSLNSRLAMLMQTKLDILSEDRKLLGALFRYTGNSEHPLSFLGQATARLRSDCMDLFAEALTPERLPEDLRVLAPTLLWALHMGILLYFLYDTSPRFERTRKLADGSVKLGVALLSLARMPLVRPARRNLMGLLRESDLIPQK